MSDPLVAQAAVVRRDVEEILAGPVLAGDDDLLTAVRVSARLRDHAAELVAAAVQRARASGCTWQQIGDALGISRQAAFQRFGKPIDPRTGETMDTTPLPEAPDLAAAVIDELAHSRWADVVARFDAACAERLGEDGLAAAWAQVIGRVGAYERHGDVHAVRAADLTITDTPLAFEAGDFVARITFRDDRTIAGLFIVPPGK